MTISIPEVQEGDFMKITASLPHLQIDQALVRIGGGGLHGTNFRDQLLKAAGWTGHKLTTYASRPAQAAAAFNIIRAALELTEESQELLTQVQELKKKHT